MLRMLARILYDFSRKSRTNNSVAHQRWWLLWWWWNGTQIAQNCEIFSISLALFLSFLHIFKQTHSSCQVLVKKLRTPPRFGVCSYHMTIIIAQASERTSIRTSINEPLQTVSLPLGNSHKFALMLKVSHIICTTSRASTSSVEFTLIHLLHANVGDSDAIAPIAAGSNNGSARWPSRVLASHIIQHTYIHAQKISVRAL